MFLKKLVKALNEHQVDFAVVGRVAMGLHGALRGTRDLDLILRWEVGQFRACQTALESLGLRCRQPLEAEEVFEFRHELIERRKMYQWSFSHPKARSIQVDVVLNENLKLNRICLVEVEDFQVPILNQASLIRMKKHSTREEDHDDVWQIENLYTGRRYDPFEGTGVQKNHATRARYLEAYRDLHETWRLGDSRMISLRIHRPLVDIFRQKAEMRGLRYQTHIKKLMEDWIKANP